MKDFYGYDRVIHKPGETATGDFGLIDIGGRVSLVVDSRVNYSQQVTPNYEVGTSDVYFTEGMPIGQFSVQRAVNPHAGFWQNFSPGTCGYLEAAVLSLGGKGNCSVTPSGKGIHMQDLRVTSVDASISAGARQITEGMQAMFAFATSS